MIYDQNAFGNLRDLLASVGVQAKNEDGYNTKFGIGLAARTPQPIAPANGVAKLLAEQGSAHPNVSAESIETLASEFGFEAGVFDMMFPYADIPPAPQTETASVTAVLASKGSVQDHVGVCVLGYTQGQYRSWLYPEGHASGIAKWRPEYSLTGFFPFGETLVALIEGPKHGTLVASEDPIVPGDSIYLPNKGYVGNDRVVFKVTVPGAKLNLPDRVVMVTYFIKVVGELDAGVDLDRLESQKCPAPSEWRIRLSEAGEFNGDLAERLRSAALPAVLADAASAVTGAFDLAGSVVGLATGEELGARITLDIDAAGWQWFIDPTPYDNAEYLPTADANIFKSRPGSAADGKMDLLSVLLHEYGHALGLEHSADARNFMAATLQPGERRLPTEGELQLMAQLVAQRRAEDEGLAAGDGDPQPGRDHPHHPDPALPAGQRTPSQRLGRRPSASGSGTGTDDAASTSTPRYATAVNPALTNGDFGAEGTAGWVATGDVVAGHGQVTLGESATSQTQLAQGFVVGATDHVLSFTVDASTLQANTFGPADAFEVALLDANTGTALGGTVPLTRSDALLNRQLDAQGQLMERLGACRTWESPAANRPQRRLFHRLLAP